MNGCNYIKERIDEADRPDVLPFEVTEHFGHCKGCEAFAIERTALRNLVAGDTRVSTPINFDAMLNARLAEVKARRSSWWLGSPAYLRFGAATAGLAVMIFAAQFAGLFSGNNSVNPTSSELNATVPAPEPRVEPLPPNPGPANPSVLAAVPNRVPYQVSSSASRSRRGVGPLGRTPEGYLTAEDGGVVLVRGRNGDMDVQMPTVSVGAQPLLYVSAGQRSVRNVGTSF
jgi:hypothetical protein